MVDFIIKGNEHVVNKISKDVLIKKLSEKIDLDLIRFMVNNQDELEVTYDKNNNSYRFDFVNIKDLVLKYVESENLRSLIINYSFMSNIDFNLSENKLVYHHAIDGIGKIVNSGLDESKKLELIKEFKEFQKELKSLGFLLEPTENLDSMSLVHKNLSDLTLDNFSRALSKVETYTFDSETLFL